MLMIFLLKFIQTNVQSCQIKERLLYSSVQLHWCRAIEWTLSQALSEPKDPASAACNTPLKTLESASSIPPFPRRRPLSAHSWHQTWCPGMEVEGHSDSRAWKPFVWVDVKGPCPWHLLGKKLQLIFQPGTGLSFLIGTWNTLPAASIAGVRPCR